MLRSDESARRDALHTLTFDSPANAWVEALPLGNGRLGAMCFGGLASARIALNDDTAWSGSPASERLPPLIGREDAADAISRAREAVDAGRHVEADGILRGIQHRHSQAYVALADLHVEVDLPEAARRSYGRRLDLRTATHEARGAGAVHRTWVSAADDVLVHEVEAAEPVAVRIRLTTPLRQVGIRDAGDERWIGIQLPSDVSPPHDGGADPVRYDDDPVTALRAAVACRLEHDGVEVDGEIRGARRVRILLATQTTYAGLGMRPAGDVETARARASERLAVVAARDPEELWDAHLRAHAALYEGAELELEAPPISGATTGRLAALQDGSVADPARDPALAALLFHYGRYLLICSSRPGTLPPTLQGIWNEDVQPVWSSNYTVNINLQMNYWGAEVTGLAPTKGPLLDLLDAVSASGAETAARIYGAPGWVLHHNTDAWAYTQQIGHGRHDASHVFWPLGGAWLLLVLAEGAEFDDPAPVLRRLLPLVRGGVEFILAWLREGPDRMLGTAPSTSPENTFVAPGGGESGIAASSAMDLVLIRQVLDRFLAATELLGVSDDLVARAADARSRLMPLPFAEDGSIAEWEPGLRAVEPHHRHLSPLVGLYPGADPVGPREEDGARRFLDARGDESTGWSLVWKMALRARLRDPQAVSRLLGLLLRDMVGDRGEFSGGLYPNLFAAHPPFQIDANLGWVGVVAELLVQSHRGEIEVLPAWPRALGEGSVRGLVARPGVTVDLEWRSSCAGWDIDVRLAARHPGAVGPVTVRFGDRIVETELPAVGAIVAVGGAVGG